MEVHMAATTEIRDRTGRKLSQRVIDKALAYVPAVRDTNLPTVWRVDGLGGTYTIVINTGQSTCSCPGGTENDGRLCSHVLAVYLRAMQDGRPVRVAQIDGPSPVLVAEDGSDPFEGLC
jgi:hypothetical protein